MEVATFSKTSARKVILMYRSSYWRCGSNSNNNGDSNSNSSLHRTYVEDVGSRSRSRSSAVGT